MTDWDALDAQLDDLGDELEDRWAAWRLSMRVSGVLDDDYDDLDGDD